MRNKTIVAAIIAALATIVAAYINKSGDKKVAGNPAITNITNVIAVGPEKVSTPSEKNNTGIKEKEEALLLVELPQKTLKKEMKLVVGQDWWEEKLGFYVKLDSMKNKNYYSDMSKKPTYCAHLLIQTPESRLFPLEVCEKYGFMFESNNIGYKVKIQNDPANYADLHVEVQSLLSNKL